MERRASRPKRCSPNATWGLICFGCSIRQRFPYRKHAGTLERIYTLADAREMKVIIDLPQGGWYGKAPNADDVIATVTRVARDLHRRYGHHASFYGWYLNYEITRFVLVTRKKRPIGRCGKR